jgi:hypothetical protein
MRLCHEQWPPFGLDCEEEVESRFIALVDTLAEGNARLAAAALRDLARLGWVVSYIGTTAPTLRQRDDAVFWFTTLDLVAAHGKLMEVAKVQRKLARLGWVVSRIEPRPTASESR